MARTTTTVIRTTQNSSGARRRSGTRSRPKARAKSRVKPRAKARATRLTTTQAERTAFKDNANKTNYLPLLGLAGLLGLGAIFFWPKGAKAAEPANPSNPPINPPINPVNPPINPPIIPGGGGTSPGGFVHPSAGTRATANATVGLPAGATPGLNLRSTPSSNGALVAALPNGTPITVIQSNVIEQGRTAASKERWWQVTANGRTGYVRAVGPGDRPADPYVWNVSFIGQQTATGGMLGMPANYTQIVRGYDAYRRPVDQYGRLVVVTQADPYRALVSPQGWGAR